MATSSRTLLQRLRDRIVPEMPDFYALLRAQCTLVERGLTELVAFMESGDDARGEAVRATEHEADRQKEANMAALHAAFSTPIDREDIYQAIAAIDEVLNYAKTTVLEMQLLRLTPDEHTLAMARLLLAGAEALSKGFRELEKDPLAAEASAEAARKTERNVEKVYRAAVAELFDPHHYVDTSTQQQRDDAKLLQSALQATPDRDLTLSVAFVLEVFKRREVYRHMSNAADKVERAGEVLHDIVAKVA